jgi:glycosyltransferase involved in cell wall biosynthesis
VIIFQSADGAVLPVAEGVARKHPTAFVYVARFESTAMDQIAEGIITVLPPLKGLRTMPRRFVQLVERFVLMRVDAVFAVSDTAAFEAKTVTRSERPPVYTIRPGIDTARFSPGEKNAARRILDIPAESTVILVVGRLARVKRYDRAIAATAELTRRDPGRRYLLMVVGDGPEAPGLKTAATAAGADVRFEGYLEGDELRARYWAADVQLCTSDAETLGFSLMEGLASALPVIGVPNGAAEWLRRVDPSFVLADSEPHTIADRVHSVLSSERLADLQQHARRYAVENLDWRVVHGDFERRMQDLIGSHAARRS